MAVVATNPSKHYDGRPRFGLALGGGAVRGLAHLGVLRVLERFDLRPDIICGTSSGAIVAGAFAAGCTADDLIETALQMRWKTLLRPSVRRNRLFDTSGLHDFIEDIIPVRDFDQLQISYACVAEDLRTGNRVVLSSGDPARAADASAAVRRAFPPVNIGDRVLVDGVGVEPVPVRAARELGATYVVAVDVLRVTPTRRLRTRMSRRDVCSTRAADFVIRPALGNRSAWSLSLASEIISLGERAAEASASTIGAALALSA